MRQAETDFKRQDGIVALVSILASLYGHPRNAFRAMDTRKKGRISLCEFDAFLRYGIGLSCAHVTGMESKAIFHQLRAMGCYVLREGDLAVFPEIWHEELAAGTCENT